MIDAPRAVDADLTGPTDTPIVPCTDTTAAVYVAVARPNAPLGTILACVMAGGARVECSPVNAMPACTN